MMPRLFSALRHTLLWLPAFSLLLAPLAARAARPSAPDRDLPRAQRFEESVSGGRAGIIDEVNMGPLGARALRPVGEKRVLSGRVLELRGQTLYVERGGVVVPLELSALRITQQPRAGQEIVATYTVDRTQNRALSLAGEVAASD
jgi:hypothetical protein